MSEELTDMVHERLLRLKSAHREMIVDVNGGRIKSFSIDGKNALVDQGIQTGSTFWPSPQSLWGWPPPPVLDEQPYRVLVDVSATLQLESEIEPSLGVSIVKTIIAIDGGFRVEYTIVNQSQSIVTIAPWEISRVSGGLSFYCASSAPEAISTCSVEEAKGHYWFQYQVEHLQGIPKVFANNSDGWLANVNHGLLLVKRFPRIPKNQIAPTEAEIEIYAHADPVNPYIELEAQGPFKAITPGQRRTWAVDWLLAALPSELDISLGSAELLDYVYRTLTETPISESSCRDYC